MHENGGECTLELMPTMAANSRKKSKAPKCHKGVEVEASRLQHSLVGGGEHPSIVGVARLCAGGELIDVMELGSATLEIPGGEAVPQVEAVSVGGEQHGFRDSDLVRNWNECFARNISAKRGHLLGNLRLAVLVRWAYSKVSG